MMDYRENAGYVITDSCHVGESEFVLGVHLTAPQQFVTWKCKDRTDYYWGHYFSSLFDAQKDLVARAHEEVQYLEQRGIDPNKMELEPADSPWGEIQTCHTLCPGAYSVSTAGSTRAWRNSSKTSWRNWSLITLSLLQRKNWNPSTFLTVIRLLRRITGC